jgi:hypothetical protein
MSRRPPNALLWFGVLGGPLAWALEHVAGYAFGLAQCEQPVTRWQLPLHGWQIALAAGAALISLAAEAVSLRIFFRTRETGNAPPAGRVHFMSVVGLTVNPLALAIILMTGVGAPLLTLCQQS